MTNQQELSEFSIRARAFDTLQIDAGDSPGFYMLDINVEQSRGVLDDIGAYVVDHDNFLIWRTWKQTTGTAVNAPSHVPLWRIQSDWRMGVLNVNHPVGCPRWLPSIHDADPFGPKIRTS